jgi:hypothetical protein
LKEKDEKAASHGTEGLGFLTWLLDPHFHDAERGDRAGKSIWSRRRAYAFILVASLVLWTVIMLGVFYLIGLF